MIKHGKITTFCLLLLFMILGSITMMLFLKNKGVDDPHRYVNHNNIITRMQNEYGL